MTTDLIEPAVATTDPPAATLITAIRPEHIRIDGGTQARAGLDPAAVAEYVEAMRELCSVQNGLERIPPIVVFHDGSAYWLADGFHRLEAYTQLQALERPAPPTAIRAEVRQGTRRDAVLYAAGANADHGLRRTRADKERAVLVLLQDEEWGQWSDREIARRCKVSHVFVALIAERHGLSTGRASSARKTADGRTMDTSGIAAANQARGAVNHADGFPAPTAIPNPLIVHDTSLLNRAAAQNVAMSYSETGKIIMFDYAGRRWACIASLSKAGAFLSAEGCAVVSRAAYPGQVAAWTKHGRNGPGTLARYRNEELVITDQRIKILPGVPPIEPPARSCEGGCGAPYGAPGSMQIDGKLLCPRCASATMTAQSEAQARDRSNAKNAPTPAEYAAAQARAQAIGLTLSRDEKGYSLLDAGLNGVANVASWMSLCIELHKQEQTHAELQQRAPAAAAHRLTVAAERQLEACGWTIRRAGAEYRLAKGADAYATDAAGVIALAALAVERPDATPDELAAAVSASEDGPPAATTQPRAGVGDWPCDIPPDFDAVLARFQALGWRVTKPGFYPDDRYAMYPPAPHPGIGNATWHGVLSRLEAIEQPAAPIAPALPTAPAGWTIWRNDGDTTIGMRHACGLALSGDDPAALIAEATQLARPLAELTDHAWRVIYVPDCPAGLHAYTAIHDEFEAIAASDLAHLALLAWRARLYEDDLPDAPDDLIDALWLAGYDWSGANWLRDGEILPGDMSLNELGYLAGLDAARAAPVCACGNLSVGRHNIGGTLADRCRACAAREEEHDLREQLGAQYHTPIVNDDGVWHYIVWADGTTGNYTYDEALAMYHSLAMTLRRFASGTPTPREAAAAWLGQMSATLQRAPASTMFRYDEMQQAAQHVAVLLAATPAPYAPMPAELSEHGLPPTLAELEADPLAAIASMLDTAEGQVARGHTGITPRSLLADCRRRLDLLADDTTIPTDAYEDLARRIGDAQARLAEAMEVAG